MHLQAFRFSYPGINGHENLNDDGQMLWERWSLYGDRMAAIGKTYATTETLTNLFLHGLMV